MAPSSAAPDPTTSDTANPEPPTKKSFKTDPNGVLDDLYHAFTDFVSTIPTDAAGRSDLETARDILERARHRDWEPLNNDKYKKSTVAPSVKRATGTIGEGVNYIETEIDDVKGHLATESGRKDVKYLHMNSQVVKNASKHVKDRDAPST